MSLFSRIAIFFRGNSGDAMQATSSAAGHNQIATSPRTEATTTARPGFFSSIRSAIKNFFSSPKSSITPPGAPLGGTGGGNGEPDSGTPPKFKEINVGIEDTELLVAPGIDKFIRERGSEFWQLGFDNGIKGIKSDTIGSVARAQAVNLVEFIRASSQGKLEKYKSDMEVKKKIMDDEEDRYRDAQEHLDEMTHSYHKHPRSFSLLLFMIYFSIAIFLIIADVPLAKTLTEKGFNLEVDSIGSWLLTFGIAFCAVYIKIYYDDYVATPIGHFISQFKKIPGIIGDRNRNNRNNNFTKDENDEFGEKVKKDFQKVSLEKEDNKEELERKIKREVILSRLEYWLKFAVKTIVLVFTLSTIWVLGEFRYQNVTNPERDIIMEYVNWVVLRMGEDPYVTTKAAFATTLLAFRMITLIFPIIGGVCLSLALTNLQNIRRFSKAKSGFAKYQGEFLKALEKFNEASKKYQDYKGISKRWHEKDKDDRHTQDFTDVFRSYYTLGYDNGLTQSDFFDRNADLYTQIEKMRRKLIARRVYNSLLDEVPLMGVGGDEGNILSSTLTGEKSSLTSP